MTPLIRSTREQITDLVREDILCGRLAEGQRLGETELAQRFGVSRGPIREAFALLAQEGLLETRPNCGVKVAVAAPDAIRELIVPVRRTMETYALKLCFDELTERDFRTWDDILAAMEQACRRKDPAGIVQQDIAFHRFIVTRSGQQDLITIWRPLVARIRNHFHQAIQTYAGKLLRIHAEHGTLLAAFRNGDRNLAVKALADHIW